MQLPWVACRFASYISKLPKLESLNTIETNATMGYRCSQMIFNVKVAQWAATQVYPKCLKGLKKNLCGPMGRIPKWITVSQMTGSAHRHEKKHVKV